MKDDNIISDFDQNFETLKKQSILIEKQKSENTPIYRNEADKKFIVTKPIKM